MNKLERETLIREQLSAAAEAGMGIALGTKVIREEEPEEQPEHRSCIDCPNPARWCVGDFAYCGGCIWEALRAEGVMRSISTGYSARLHVHQSNLGRSYVWKFPCPHCQQMTAMRINREAEELRCEDCHGVLPLSALRDLMMGARWIEERRG